MMDISELQAKFSSLIESRSNTRIVMPSVDQSPMRSIGESLLNKFAYHYGQGYLFAKPMPLESLIEFVIKG